MEDNYSIEKVGRNARRSQRGGGYFHFETAAYRGPSNAPSRKLENHAAATALSNFPYNFN
jgi:hypothetical protein